MFERITFEPRIMGGRACIRGMRITVSLVLNLIANGSELKAAVTGFPVKLVFELEGGRFVRRSHLAVKGEAALDDRVNAVDAAGIGRDQDFATERGGDDELQHTAAF